MTRRASSCDNGRNLSKRRFTSAFLAAFLACPLRRARHRLSRYHRGCVRPHLHIHFYYVKVRRMAGPAVRIMRCATDECRYKLFRRQCRYLTTFPQSFQLSYYGVVARVTPFREYRLFSDLEWQVAATPLLPRLNCALGYTPRRTCLLRIPSGLPFLSVDSAAALGVPRYGTWSASLRFGLFI